MIVRAFRWASLGVVPVTVLAAVLVMSGRTSRVEGPLQVDARKFGAEVVFTIHNGDTAHLVVKSSVANSFDPASAIRIRNGRFTDSVVAGDDIVFYRID